MAQGGFKLNSNKSKSKKSKPIHKKQKQKQLSKGRKSFAAKGRKATLAKQENQTTKAINIKNEVAVAARAVGAGNTFFLKDIKEAGKKEIGKQQTDLRKKESKSVKMSERLKGQLNKLKWLRVCGGGGVMRNPFMIIRNWVDPESSSRSAVLLVKYHAGKNAKN